MPDIFTNPAAFKPFCRWRVKILRAGEDVGLFDARVFIERDETLLETTTVAERLKAAIAIPVAGDGGWNDRDHPPRVGDTVVIASGPTGVGLTFAVAAVSPLITHVYQLEARQC